MSVVAADELRRFASDIFRRAGMSDAHAAIVADVLVWADLRGIDGHGVSRISMYMRLIDDGDLDLKPTMTSKAESAALTRLDAGHAAGPIAMTSAMRLAIENARQAAIGVTLVRGTTHTAALGYYTSRAAQDGMAAIAFAASVPMMAYHGARALSLSTSPISIAVPGGTDGPVVLDMATSLVSKGRINQARKIGTPIPEGWALNTDGNPTTDARTAELLLPLGGAKGSGLSLMIEIITSVLLGNPILAEALEQTPEGRRHKQNALTIAIDVARFGDPASFAREVQRLVTDVKALPRLPGVEEIRVPGERGQRTFDARTRDGIPIPRPIYDELKGIADRLGVAMFTERSR